MEIATFLVHDRDDDGDMRVELKIEAPNETEFDIHRTKTRVVFFNASGAPVGLAEDESEAKIEAGDGFSIEPWASLKASMCGRARNDITCRALTLLMRRELLKLSDVEVPSKHGVYATHKTHIETTSLAPDIIATVLRSPPDDDGDVSLDLRVAVRNVSDKTLEAVTLSAELLDEDDAEVNSGEDTANSLDPEADALLTLSMSAKKGALKRAHIRLKLSVFHRVAQLTCEATSSPA